MDDGDGRCSTGSRPAQAPLASARAAGGGWRACSGFRRHSRPRAGARPVAPSPRSINARASKLKRGRLEVDAKLDLHGMRQAEAQRALTSFLRRAQADGAKIAIVVTGKGLTRDEGGVLRRVVPMWLQAPNLRDVVVGFGEAARHHGGEGALYVRIRRADRAR